MKERETTIMVVDDTPANLKLLEEMLRAEDYRVVAFPSGVLALKAAAKIPPDLILLDINMPEMSGIEVCERLKSDEILKEIPVIFISALAEARDKVRAFAAGGVDYVPKPFQFEEVKARVQTHLELQRQKHELQNAYERLRGLESLRDNLVHMIVHDMRTPLTVVRGYLQIISMSELPEETKCDIEEALKSTNKLVEMVGTLLDVSKMEAGQMTLQTSPIDLKEMIQQAVHEVESLREHRKLSIEAPLQPVPVTCDSSLVSRVVINLLGNALKLTDRESGEITIGLKSLAGMARVSVEDNGPGVPEEYQTTIFEKFGQVESRKEGRKYSTGLGLTFCKMAVEAHGGRIGLESQVGQGSRFWFELPGGG